MTNPLVLSINKINPGDNVELIGEYDGIDIFTYYIISYEVIFIICCYE